MAAAVLAAEVMVVEEVEAGKVIAGRRLSKMGERKGPCGVVG